MAIPKGEAFVFLKRLMDTISPTGFEKQASVVWATEAKTFADEVYGDTHGNTFAVINSKGSPKIMLAGHIDEIGMIVTNIDKDGFVAFGLLGGWDPQVLPGQRVVIKTANNLIRGVVGRKPIHLLTDEERKKVAEVNNLWIDIGASSKKEAERHLQVGNPAVVDTGFQRMVGNNLTCRGFDDRIGAFIVLEAARLAATLNPKVAIYAVGTAQEEIGTRGAITSAFGIDPKVGIAVDVGFATDTPGMGSEKNKYGDVKLGGGPIVVCGPNINNPLREIILDTAKINKIKTQTQVNPGVTGTDARSMQVTRAGVATSLISVPNRYMHTPNEMVNWGDVVDTIILIAQVVVQMDNNTNFNPGV